MKYKPRLRINQSPERLNVLAINIFLEEPKGVKVDAKLILNLVYLEIFFWSFEAFPHVWGCFTRYKFKISI